MPLHIAQHLFDQLIGEATASPRLEVCGLVFGASDRVDSVKPAANVANDPAQRFEIDPAALIAAHRTNRGGGPALIGHYHSHPNGNAKPSVCDAEMAVADGSIWLIVSGDNVMAWRAVENGALHGRFDPLPILRC